MHQLRRIHELTAFTLRGTDGDIGGIEELYVDDESWAVRYCVVNTGSWLRDRRVLLAPMAVAGVEEANWVVRIKLTREQIETGPPVDRAKPISRAYEEEQHRHFQWVRRWRRTTESGLWEAGNQRRGVRGSLKSKEIQPRAATSQRW